MTSHVSRPTLLANTVIATIAPLSMKSSANEPQEEDYNFPFDVEPKEIDHNYEVRFSEEEWRSRLSEKEFRILRLGRTSYYIF